MKVLYITAPPFFDLEISLIRELSQLVDISVVMIINHHSQRSSAFCMEDIGKEVRLVNASSCKEMDKYKDMIDLNKWNLAFCPQGGISNIMKMSRLLSAFMDKGKFDLVHNTTYSKELIPLLPKLIFFKNRVMTIHDPIPHDKPSFVERSRLALFQKVFRNKVLLSDALLEDYIRFSKTPRENIFFSRLSTYDFLTKFTDRENPYGSYLLFFGRITKYKGVELLVDAYKSSTLPAAGIKLVIAGKGTLDCTISAEQDGIIMLNRYIENDELASLIKHSMYVVLPYRSATQSGCVMSAFAFNKPILVTNVGDLPKEVEDGITGLVVEANNVKALKIGIETLQNKELLSDIEANIKEKYCDDSPYSWKSAAKQIVSAYKEIVEG